LLKTRLNNAAMDTTGLEERHTSHHFRKRKEESQKQAEKRDKKRRNQKKTPFPKLAILCDCLSHLTLSVLTGQGPAADQPYFKPLLDHAAEMFAIRQLLADAGFDGEHHHIYAKEQHDTETIIPPTVGRPTSKPPAGKNRRRMKQQWETLRKAYGQRWQAETVNSMFKRLLGSALRARAKPSRACEMVLRLLTLNIMIIAAVV
jgi:Transposase DDE domain